MTYQAASKRALAMGITAKQELIAPSDVRMVATVKKEENYRTAAPGRVRRPGFYFVPSNFSAALTLAPVSEIFLSIFFNVSRASSAS